MHAEVSFYKLGHTAVPQHGKIKNMVMTTPNPLLHLLKPLFQMKSTQRHQVARVREVSQEWLT